MTGNPAIDKILIALNGLGVAAATGLVIYAHTSIKRPSTDPNAEMGNMTSQSIEQTQLATVNFPKLVTNLYSRHGRLRYVDLQYNLLPFKEEDAQKIQDLKALINDTIIEVVGNMPPEELNSVTGRILLETRVKKSVNSYLNYKLVKKIYFSRFIIQ